MVKTYTAQQKETLLRRFRQQRQERRANLVSEMQKMAVIFESKILRRSNSVPKKFTELQIKDVLTVERDHKIKMFQLIQEVQLLKNETLANQTNHDVLYKEMERIRTHRKQSIIGNRVAKPEK